MSTSFSITFDYLCPFARNANEHVVAALRAGADWDVEFTPYSLAQGHVEEGQPAVWDREEPLTGSGILALVAGLDVRDRDPERFLDAHERLFAARHDEGADIKDPDVVLAALDKAGVDADAVLARIGDGTALATLRQEHQRNVDDHGVWGVPTFIGRERAVFVRLLDRPDDGATSSERIERIVELVDTMPELHEFKQATLDR